MNQLINITKNNGNNAVSARELHAFLIKDAKGGQIGEDFSHWIERKLEYGYELGIDYTTIGYDYLGEVVEENGSNKDSESENEAVRVHKRDYILTIDTAKELAMLQNNDKGKQARRYFIAIEKKATQPQPAMLDKNQQHHTLLAALKQNLKRGDMKDIANENGFTYDAVRNIFYASSRRPEVIKAIFEKALENKKIAVNPQEMINQLLN